MLEEFDFVIVSLIELCLCESMWKCYNVSDIFLWIASQRLIINVNLVASPVQTKG